MEASSSPPAAPTPPAPRSQSSPPPSNLFEPPSETQVQRSKLAWRLFVIGNFGVAAYIFFVAKRRSLAEKSNKSPVDVQPPPPALPPPSDLSLLDFDYEPDIVPSSPNSEPILARVPISEDEKREVLQWMLEEKRRIKPKDSEEKRKVDREKAILKRFIRAESIPPV